MAVVENIDVLQLKIDSTTDDLVWKVVHLVWSAEDHFELGCE
jgi:hypothetical protein